jgi:DNA-binding transcriptional regulator LsrR (DeoR family)
MQQQQQLEWRRAKVLELMSKGETNQSEIARILQVDRSTICRDVDYLRQQARENIARYVDERLPEEYEKCLVGLNSILKEAWTISQTENIKGDKIKALVLAKECYAMKLEMLTNAMVVDDAIRFAASHAVLTDKANSGKVDADIEDRAHDKQQPSIATTNTVF